MNGADDESLRDLLRRAHERLSRTATVDSESRALLVSLTQDIERALAGRSGARPDAPPVQRLEALAVRFEADHPALAQVLRQLIDALGKAGI
jgi:hypothetical protein